MPEDMPPSFPRQQDELDRWLEANVQRYSSPRGLVLKNFEIDPSRFKGKFNVDLDGQPVPGAFSFSVEGNGLPQVFLPMFHSPLGVPASFAAVSLTDKTQKAVEAGLKHFIPRLRPFGIDKNTGEWVTQSTPLHERVVDLEAMAAFRRIVLSDGFQVEVQVEPLRIQLQARLPTSPYSESKG